MGTTDDHPAAPAAGGMGADEIALYDRQIRLWGVQAQENIRKANILIIRAKALANEVAKNLVLAGIASITLIDHENVTEDDLGAQFLLDDKQIGQNRAEACVPELQKLNPRVKVTAISDNVTQKLDLNVFVTPYDLVIATDLDFATMRHVSMACRLASTPFYLAGAHGIYGFIFADLIQHEFSIEREKFNAPSKLGAETMTRAVIKVDVKKDKGEVKETVIKREIYSQFILANTSPLPAEILSNRRKLKQVTPLLSCLRALWEFETTHGRLPQPLPADLKDFTVAATSKHRELQLPIETLKSEFLRSFCQNLGCELAPVTAVLGGQVAQDAINVLGKREQPIQNFVMFDGEEYQAPVYALHPIFNDGLDGVIAAAPGPAVALAANGAMNGRMSTPVAMGAQLNGGVTNGGHV